MQRRAPEGGKGPRHGGGERHLPRPLRLLDRFLRRHWQGLAVSLVVVALGVGAFISPGLVQADVRLDEGTVYGIKRDSDMVGMVNAQIDQLASATTVGDTQVELLQYEDTVLLHLPQSSRLTTFNPGRNTLGSLTQLPSNAVVQLVGDQLLVYNPSNGRVWHGDVATVLDYDFQKQTADLEVGEDGVATLTTDGDVIGLDPSRSVLVRASADGESTVETPLPFELDPVVVDVELSAVGDRAVVLDRTSGRIWVESMDRAYDVSGASTAQLAAPSADALDGEDGTRALYVTQAGLIALTSDGPRSLSGQLDETPVSPVQVGDCVYAAFHSDGVTFVKKCVGEDASVTGLDDLTTDGSALSLQVNRGAVTLNDAANGTIWLLDKGVVILPVDWEAVAPVQESDELDYEDGDSDVVPDRSQENRAPIAKDDTLAARAGRSTVLTVLDNDTDPDGDVLSISAPGSIDGATLEPIRDGAGLQITLPNEASGTFTFTYTVDDGRGGTDSAEVTVRVVDADITKANSAPHKFERAQPLEVQLGSRSITKRVLLDWRDPDGDPLMLLSATMDPRFEDIVRFTADGQITYTDVGKTTGTKIIEVVVTDGRDSTTGELVVEVSEDPVAPVAFGDFATVTVDQSVTVEPLANDVGVDLTLSEVTTDCSECTLEPNYRDKTFAFSAPKAGEYYVTYTVTNGQIGTGLVRIDVRGTGTNQVPIAALDVALLPPGGSVLVDPLLNDTDADGDVLVIQTYTAPGSLEVVMDRRHLMTISARHTPDAPTSITYRVSDGSHSVLGTIVVIPTQAVGSTAPRAEDDELEVRAGASARVDVLTNDTSPIGLDLTIGELTENPLGEQAWIDGDTVRVTVPAGTPAGARTISYTAVDSEGNTGTARLALTVVSEDAQNEAPAPRQVVDRVLAGTTTRIAIPLDGIDPNGDAVRLIGLGSGPTLGRVLGVGEGYLTYQAYEESQGTDTFSYDVVDSLGERARGEVRIGIAQPSRTNTPPVGVMDEITVRPGRQVQIAALANDFDADGDTLGYTSDDPVEMDDDILAQLVGGREIVLQAPAREGTYVGRYDIVDARGELAYGDIRLVVDKDAPLLAPVTRDDSVAVSSLIDRDWVEVDVMANDYDPDGSRDQLSIEVPDYGADEDSSARLVDGAKVSIPVLDRMQQIRYVLIDGDGNRTNSLIIVPGRGDSVPVLKDPDQTLDAVAGQPLEIDVNNLVAGTRGRDVRLTTESNLSATHGRLMAAGEAKVIYVPDESYDGPASVVFEVTDKVREGDTSGEAAFVSIPVTVHPAPNRPEGSEDEDNARLNLPPTLAVDTPVLRVGPDEGESRLDLLALFRDPEGDTMFVSGPLTAGQGDADLDWRTEGDRLYASAPITAEPGSYREVSGLVVDAMDNETPFTVSIQVTASTRPTVTVATDVVEKAVAGEPITIHPLANDRSNLLGDQSLTLLGATRLSGEGALSYDAEKQTVTITPSGDWHGAFTASYTVNDATADPDRRVDGTIRVTVLDVPGQPSTPFEGVAGDGQVSVKYLSGGDGGTDITSRVATASSPGLADRTAECGVGVCTVTGLKNGVPWQISVTEINEVGPSEPSRLSAAVIPDAVPLAPSKPSVEFGDGELTVSWTHDPQYSSKQGGSAIATYIVRLLDSGGREIGSPVEVKAPTKTYTWKGLTNGTTYLFTVEAKNSNPQKALTSPPSDTSTPEHPNGKPSGNVTPEVTAIRDGIGGGFSVTFERSEVDTNGDAIDYFVVTPVTADGESTANAERVEVGAATGRVKAEIHGMGQTPTKFSITAANRSGEAKVGGTSAYTISYPPPEVTAVKVTPADAALQVKPSTNIKGDAATFEYSLDGATWAALPSGGTIGGLVNGQQYSVSVRALVEDMTSAARTADPVRPRSDRPNAPTLSTERVLRDFEEIQIDVNPMTWESTGGWDPSDYRFCSRSSDCDPTDPGRVRKFEPGEWGTLRWRYDGFDTSSISVDLTDHPIEEPDFDGDTLGFRFPYVQTGSCTVTLDGGADSFTVDISGGELYYSGTPTYTVSEGDEDVKITATTAQVTCTANGASKRFGTVWR
ncbi:fibronectin type III domain-containing protein [Tessaracoccus palaemonis]|uniref:Cadherin-like domain-containing protein n=1 Tax=Tessaracoccus palaemonis TaxID=2829499 RepID=A0ABX8SLB4_9ACTN|nr:fibronectin type III domain-containing protein [Tessaracoccus palaemonis]QXT63210.1 cadherin-like domain-containing protein [Tessaracoccus palaemonis]